MSPNEYKAKVNDFTKAIKNRCDKEGISIEVRENVGMFYGGSPNSTLYVLGGNEGYLLTNDGNNCNWQFIGNVV